MLISIFCWILVVWLMPPTDHEFICWLLTASFYLLLLEDFVWLSLKECIGLGRSVKNLRYPLASLWPKRGLCSGDARGLMGLWSVVDSHRKIVFFVWLRVTSVLVHRSSVNSEIGTRI